MSILQELAHLRIPYEDLKHATNNFASENLVGPGGYEMVYKGELLTSQGLTTVAVKLVDRRFSDSENHFLNEIKMLSCCKHGNIVSLIGFCDENDRHKMLVQDFVTYGSLNHHLSSANLTWLKRLEICLGVARGLCYLHNGLDQGETSVIHRLVTSKTILLDKNWQAKISGFGLSMIGPLNPSFFVKDSFWAPGFADPTYLQTGLVTKESDIYSFGVVLFEILCGRQALERGAKNNKMQFLGPFAQLHYKEGRLNQIIDPILWEQMNPDSLKDFSALAYQCLEMNRIARPTMNEIVQKLENVLILQQNFEKAMALQKVALGLKEKQEDDEYDSYKVKNLDHMKIPLEHIKLATNNFHDDCIIGRGGYGKVYKADLFHFDVQKYVRENTYKGVPIDDLLGYQRIRSTVAMKRLDRRYGQGTAEFLQEISVLLNFRHQNLVTLVGFCDEDHEHILVYEYASNGSLDEYISNIGNRNSPTWAQRLQICLDAAHGLEFLHNGVGGHHRIIHRDIKSSNILLDHSWVGKISDFGLSRIGPANLQATFVMTQVAGTLEYVDPQYHKTGMLTKGSDVYSFGVVLFEVLSGRLACFQRSKDDQEYLPHMAKRCYEQNNVNELIDPNLKQEFENHLFSFDDETLPDSICIFATIAYKCIQEKRNQRPAMSEVVEELEKALKCQVKGVEALRISIDAIRFTTNDFTDIIEHEGHGKVYKGKLSHSKGHYDVMVKRLDGMAYSYGNDFYKVISTLFNYSHKNVIKILGFCEEEGERIVVFDHMVNGSLKEHVKDTNLTWMQHLKICIDVGHGLAYIHSLDDTNHSIHVDIKSSSILLNHDWKAVISNFIISKGIGTLGYCDPLSEITGTLTQKSDIYSFGVVLFETLSGRLAIENTEIKPQPSHGDNHEKGRVIFLSQMASQGFKSNRLQEIIFHDIKEQISAKSLIIFSTIAYQCLQEQQEDRPTMDEVVKALEKAYECQDEWEWEKNLPKDYNKIIHMSKHPMVDTSNKKDLYSILSSGILLHNEKLWFSISMDGVRTEMVSAKMFSYKNVKWRPVGKSRFSKVAKISDISNLNIHIHIKPQLISPEVMYGAYLVFKFCHRRKVSSRPLYVNLKYKKDGETLNTYFAEWRDESQWLMIELFRFSNDKETTNYDVLLESFSRYHCGNWDIFVEGVEFNAIPASLKHKENDGQNDEKMATNCREIINTSENKGEEMFSLSKMNGKKCHMISAKSAICDSSNAKIYRIKSQAQSRSEELVEILSYHEFQIKCDIETQMLSTNTSYACFLVFKLSEKYSHGLDCPAKVRDLLSYNKERTKIISFTNPSILNLNKIKWIPEERGNGWMEVKVWETISDHRQNDEFIPIHLKLICFEGTMSGLIIRGFEFRPI